MGGPSGQPGGMKPQAYNPISGAQPMGWQPGQPNPTMPGQVATPATDTAFGTSPALDQQAVWNGYQSVRDAYGQPRANTSSPLPGQQPYGFDPWAGNQAGKDAFEAQRQAAMNGAAQQGNPYSGSGFGVAPGGGGAPPVNGAPGAPPAGGGGGIFPPSFNGGTAAPQGMHANAGVNIMNKPWVQGLLQQSGGQMTPAIAGQLQRYGFPPRVMP